MCQTSTQRRYNSTYPWKDLPKLWRQAIWWWFWMMIPDPSYAHSEYPPIRAATATAIVSFAKFCPPWSEEGSPPWGTILSNISMTLVGFPPASVCTKHCAESITAELQLNWLQVKAEIMESGAEVQDWGHSVCRLKWAHLYFWCTATYAKVGWNVTFARPEPLFTYCIPYWEQYVLNRSILERWDHLSADCKASAVKFRQG